ncbi:MAG: serine hydrolase [Pseudomonadota bacterium]
MQLPPSIDKIRVFLRHLLKLDVHGMRRLIRLNTLFHEDKIVWNFSNLDQLFSIVKLNMPSGDVSAFPVAPKDIPQSYDVEGQTKTLSDHFKDRNVKSFLVFKDRTLIHETYLQNVRPSDPHISWSMSKSVMSILLGVLIDRGDIPIEALEYKVSDHVPSLKGTGYDGVTLLNVLNMASGVAFNEDYMDYHSDINKLGRVIGVGGSLDAFAAGLDRKWAPGTYNHYVSVDTHVIGMMIRALTGQPMVDLLNRHVIEPMGFEHPGFFLSDDFGEPFVLGGLNISSRDFGRLGLMMLNNGYWNGRQIVSEDWVARSTAQSAPPPAPEDISDKPLGYGYQWWIPPDPMEGEFNALGIYGQYIYINRPLDVVIVQNAADTKFREGDGIITTETLALFRAIAQAVAV